MTVHDMDLPATVRLVDVVAALTQLFPGFKPKQVKSVLLAPNYVEVEYYRHNENGSPFGAMGEVATVTVRIPATGGLTEPDQAG